MKKNCIIFIALLSSFYALAQEDVYPESASYQGRALLYLIPEIEIGFPLNRFNEKIDNDVLLGKGFSIFYRFKNKPIDLGLRFGDYSYDHVRRIYDDNQQKTKNKIWVWYAAFRFEPKIKLPFHLYFEGSLGLNHYKTKTYTKEIGAQFFAILFDRDENLRFDENNLHSDWGTNYGGSIGAYFYLEKNHHSAIDIQVGYRSGSTAKFYVKKEIAIQERPLDNYEEREGALSMFSLKIGISIFGAFSK